MRAMGKKVWGTPSKIATWERTEDGRLLLPRGATGLLRTIAAELGERIVWRDTRVSVPVKWPQFFADPKDRDAGLRPYQARAQQQCLKFEQGIVRAPTGSGKTHTALSVFAAAGQRALVIMRDRQLLEQWVEKAGVHLGMRPPQIGIVQGSRRKPGECLTVALQQTLWSKRFPLREFAQHFGAIGVDEVQGAAATTVQFVVDAFPARYRFGFSADETRADGKEFLIYDLFGSVLDEVSREEVERDGFTCPVIVRLVPTDFEADWYVNAPAEERDFAQLIDTMISDPGREHVLLDVLQDLLNQHLVPIFVFTHRRQHAEKVAQVVPATMNTTCGLMMGGEDSVAGFGEARDALRAGRMKIAVGTFQAIGTGIDIPGLFAGVVSTPLGKKNRQFFNQVRGRICRPSPGKKVGYLYYLWDRKVLPNAPRSLLDWNDGKVEVFDTVKRQWTLCDSDGDPADAKPKRKRA